MRRKSTQHWERSAELKILVKIHRALRMMRLIVFIYGFQWRWPLSLHVSAAQMSMKWVLTANWTTPNITRRWQKRVDYPTTHWITPPAQRQHTSYKALKICSEQLQQKGSNTPERLALILITIKTHLWRNTATRTKWSRTNHDQPVYWRKWVLTSKKAAGAIGYLTWVCQIRQQ